MGNGADVPTGAGLQDALLHGHNVTLGRVPPRDACGRRVLHVAAVQARRTAVVEGPLFHGVEQCEVEWRSVEEAGPPVREAAGQSRASTEAEWCSLVDVRWFCEQRWLFVGDSFEGPKARGTVVEVISPASKP